MALIDLYGNKILDTGNTAAFFDIERPLYTNLYNGAYSVGGITGGGEINTSVTGCFASDFMAIPGGAYLYVGVRSDLEVNPRERASILCGCRYLAFYDAAKGFIRLVNSPAEHVRIPEGAAYCRVSWQYASLTDLDTGLYFVGVVNAANEIPAWERYYEPGEIKSAYLKHKNLTWMDKNLHEGKKWLLFGDSLAADWGGRDWQASTSPVGGDGWREREEAVPWTGYFWATRIARELGLTLDNRAVSGSGIHAGADGCGVDVLEAFLAEMDAGAACPDFITVHFSGDAPAAQLGTAGDSSKTTATVCGAVKYFIEKLRERCPNAVMGFVLPPQSSRGGDGRAAIKSVLDLDAYAVPYIDLWKESGITADMLPDGIHVSSRQANNLYYHALRRFLTGL